MSEMSYLEKLLDGVEVEWKTLGSIAELKRGTSITKKDVIDGTIPVVAGGRTPAYYHNTSNRDGQTIVIAGSGAYAGFVSWWEEPIFVSDAFTVKPHNILLPRYCYHFLMNMQQQLHEFKSGGGVPHVYPRDVSPILIPIPCPDTPEKSLAIQSEIVRILDKFTALTAELTAELNMRKKQYNYYRDQLLSFKEGEVEWKTLGEVAVIGTGNHDTQDAIEHGKYIFYARGREPLKLNVFDFDETAIITAGDGAGVGKVFHYAKGKYALHQRCISYCPKCIYESAICISLYNSIFFYLYSKSISKFIGYLTSSTNVFKIPNTCTTFRRTSSHCRNTR